MSAIRHLTRAAVTGGTALIATCLTAAPAFAANASVQLARLPSRMVADADPAPLVGQVTNTSRDSIDTVQVVFVIQMSGLDANEVSIGDLEVTEDGDRLLATEEISGPAPRRSKTVSHQLQFLAGAPSGRATVTMEVYLLDDDGDWRRVDSARTTTTVQGAPAKPSATPSETASAQPSGSPSPGGTAPSPGPPAAPDQDGALWPLYVLGLLLVGGGGGLAAVLLLRRSRDTADGEPAYVAGYGYPNFGGYPEPPTAVIPEAPTMIMPAVTDADPQGPAGGYGRHRRRDP